VHPENFTVKGWGMVHDAGFLTYPHHDAEGTLTWIWMEVGVKMWVYFRPRSRQNECSHLQNIAMHLVNFTENMEWLKQHCDTEVITPLPGNILCRHSLMYVLALTCLTISIQPPCMMHAVYTPIASFATGGHFYHYGCMHLTELA
jgi:hypothetical protein